MKNYAKTATFGVGEDKVMSNNAPAYYDQVRHSEAGGARPVHTHELIHGPGEPVEHAWPSDIEAPSEEMSYTQTPVHGEKMLLADPLGNYPCTHRGPYKGPFRDRAFAHNYIKSGRNKGR